MPRYTFKIGNGTEVADEAAIELADRDAVRAYLRETLTAMLRDQAETTGIIAFTAKAYDEAGKLAMRAQASFTVVEV